MFHRFLSFGVGLLSALSIGLTMADDVRFNRDVRSILSNHCFTCHGPDTVTRQGGLRLDVRESAVRKADSGRQAIIPGNASASEVIRRVTSRDDDIRMPPPDGPASLSEKQIAVLRTWIEQGAEYQQHWAFVSPTQPDVPQVGSSEWPRNAVDNFVLAALHQKGMQPAAEAEKETLIRRVAFDVTGLPPTLEEIDEFLADTSDDAYETMVDRYLASPAYGEHMARHWLDLARYADTNGYQYDTEREQWVWRDWVIHAYNENKPFDEFTTEQLAGDLLPNATPLQRLATGFNRNHGITIEGGVIGEEYRTEYVMDRLVTTGAVWMGLTVGCARCHDHKYDPLSQRDFYQMYAFFNQVPEKGQSGFDPRERIRSPLAGAQEEALAEELAALKRELALPIDVDGLREQWASSLAEEPLNGWQVLQPHNATSSGGSTFVPQDDGSLVVGGANPSQDVYDITAHTDAMEITAVRLEALTHGSLPGGGPGRHSNSNFVLSEFELTAVSQKDGSQTLAVKFVKAMADYSQKSYEVGKAIDGTVANNNGWAVDGPTRKQNAAAMFVADRPFGFPGGTELRFRLRHEAGFATHGIGRPRFSITTDAASSLKLDGIPADIRRIAAMPLPKRTADEAQQLTDYFLQHHHPQQSLKDRMAAIESELAGEFPATMIMQDMPQPRATHILNRGQYNEPTEAVSADVPAVFPKMPDGAPANRLGFAKWLVDPRHPLTARVTINRDWQRLFGIGLVKTSEDFGVQGDLPSHPELLDWLAVEFIKSGWDVRQMQKLMLTSATYRQSSHVGAAAYARDPENRWLARGPRLRLDAEEVRDAALAVSGLLVNKIGGRSVYPYQPPGLWLELNNRPGYSKAYPVGSGDDLYRRSMYTFWKRTVPSPMLKTFDAPEREFCTIRRSRTNTPLQALMLFNGPQFVEAARHLAHRMLTEGGDSVDDRIAYGFRLVTARAPKSRELTVFREALNADSTRFADDSAAVTKLLEVGESPVSGDIDRIELAAYTNVARLLLNLNEAITKG
ncbi:MAG: PSD1 and planctomycete cytochrome C domain-containing protein [Planctomycetaceae bacterium]